MRESSGKLSGKATGARVRAPDYGGPGARECGGPAFREVRGTCGNRTEDCTDCARKEGTTCEEGTGDLHHNLTPRSSTSLQCTLGLLLCPQL